jgi:L-ascorbate metabolism protein UlaG (beta-lactamase superfamily)
MAAHDLTERDLRVRNVPTNVREYGGTRYNGNSIFVFEVADLCIAHLGHLHHTLSDVHLGELGYIDVLLVPADGAYTMAQELMAEVVRQIGPTLVIPMHYFSPHTVARFLTLIEDSYQPVFSDSPTVTLSSLRLPYRKVLVLSGG